MKKFSLILVSLLWLFANAQFQTRMPGQPAPDFKLRNVTNQFVSFADYPDAKGFILIFTCNTCPYSKAYEQRMLALNKKFAPRGYPVIAINPNDPETSPGDRFKKMQERAKAKNYTFPYLYDEGQVITALYGPRSTPHIFVVQKTAEGNRVAYSGAIDNDLQNTSADKINYVDDAVTALLLGKAPEVTTTKAIGCRISWKKTK
jgi:peroxiredoxin